ncbi:MAG TPA: tannase/feruloyl esterase family alpha/beta hydrolase, partial [Longimicrobiales bacterium]|nr:tannase/feruloyl esterase family alpha/beta hydrolase [Longimicrobiales bacterium]
LMWGDGGKDGDLDFADHRLAEGYAVANTNMGHDAGAEPGSSFAFDNRQAEIDFGYRAVHLTVVAGKEIVDAYYGRTPEYSYFEGCSTGGREGLMEAQRYPYDFDGIVAGAPAHLYQELNASRTWLLQRMYLNDFAGSLSFDTDGDGLPDSPRKLELLIEAVLAKCDAIDGIEDGVIDDPRACDFDPAVDLRSMMCGGDVNGEACFTRLQLRNVGDFYAGAYDSSGHRVYPGHAFGSEAEWMRLYVPHRGNRYAAGALGVTADHLNYLFYETDPGVPLPSLTDLSLAPDATRTPPEWAWWQFDIDDVTRGEGDLMKGITDASDPDLTRFLDSNGGKLILYHGWSDALITPVGTVEYYEEMVDATFGGDVHAAREHVRLFMIPGMGHCSGGPGPNSWDKLAPLVQWVERGEAPDAVVAQHRTDGLVDNERPIFAFPDRAVYSGPAGGQDDPRNWVPANFSRR